MTGTELEVRTQQVVSTINDPVFLDQIEKSLPENVSMKRFTQVAITAVRANPKLVEADQNSLFASIIACAQDGLFADGKQAALVIYKGKVAYLPMIGGVRKIAAEYGWAIRTECVYENDAFEYTAEPPVIKHTPLRPGQDRGDILYAYAVAVHSNGMRLQKVMHREEIEKRRAMAQTDAVWKAWKPQMYEKTVGHEIMDEIPLSDHERFVRALAASKTAESEAADAAELLYGPDAVIGERFNVDTGEIVPATAPNVTEPATELGDESQQAGTAAPTTPLAAVPVPGHDDEEPQPPAAKIDELAAAKAAGVASTKVTIGAWAGQTLQQVLDAGEDGEKWLVWALKHPAKFDDAFVTAVDVFVKGAMQAKAA